MSSNIYASFKVHVKLNDRVNQIIEHFFRKVYVLTVFFYSICKKVGEKILDPVNITYWNIQYLYNINIEVYVF